MTLRDHWEHVYQTKPDKDLSWFQSDPAVSRALIESLPQLPERFIDVGGGQSCLVADLLSRGVPHVAVLDISNAALNRARERLGAVGDDVAWINADILDPSLELGQFDLWHDRAAFHFLTDPADRRRYTATALRTVPAGGHLVIATFAPNGPEKCSGLPVRRYDAAAIAAEFGPGVQLIQVVDEIHATPWGKPQTFVYALLQRVADAWRS